MTNRSIDRQIAELMGYELHKTLHLHHTSEIGEWDDIPYFSTDGNAMLKLAEWLQEKRISMDVVIGKGGCDVTLYSHSGFQDNGTYSADTAPLALCQAVLFLPMEVLK
jgi:hypothetical protein